LIFCHLLKKLEISTSKGYIFVFFVSNYVFIMTYLCDIKTYGRVRPFVCPYIDSETAEFISVISGTFIEFYTNDLSDTSIKQILRFSQRYLFRLRSF
jgi:hypothetical protein